jgi:16S rRNA (cytosine967-C5)-methyltransferase
MLLEQGAKLVEIGGILVYATCTIRNAENIDIVKAFEAQYCDEFEPAPLAEAFGAALATDVLDKAVVKAGGRGAEHVRVAHWVSLMPHLHGTDGFFIARWRRKRD